MATAIQQSGYTPEKAVPRHCDLKVKLLEPDAKAPFRTSTEAAGLDVHTYETVTIPIGEQVKIPTKIAIELPKGYHGQLHVRSSLASKHQACIETGIIDSDYRGEIFILLSNNGNNDITITKGDRIAQLIIVKDPEVEIIQTDELSTTERAAGGFGSTNEKAHKHKHKEHMHIPMPVPPQAPV